MGNGHRRRVRGATGGEIRIEPPPSDRLWLIATHSGHGSSSESIWAAYARRSAAPVAFMNATAARWQGNSARPPSQLSTLGPAVSAIGSRPHLASATLVMFMHGVADITRSYGYLHSLGTGYTLDVDWLSQHDWSDRVLVIGWQQRNSNAHYVAFVQAVQSLHDVAQLHLYGCTIGGAMFRAGLLDLAVDLGKEIWAYTGYTHTTSQRLRVINVHDEAAPSANGAALSGSTYRQVLLQADDGNLLPGWQVRAYVAGGEPRLDIYSAGEFGPQVEVHNRSTLDSALASPLRSISLS
jgi:hypothetical protein